MILGARASAAFEDAITDYKPTALANIEAAKGKPQYYPREIAECYPDLTTEKGRMAYIRVIKDLPKDPILEHVRAVIAYTNMLRSSQDYFDAWTQLKPIFPEDDAVRRRDIFVDIIVLWATPSTRKKAHRQNLIEFEMDAYPYASDIHVNAFEWTPETLNKREKELLGMKSQLEKKLNERYHTRIEDELLVVDQALLCIKLIKMVWAGDYYSLWDELKPLRLHDDAISQEVYDYIAVYRK